MARPTPGEVAARPTILFAAPEGTRKLDTAYLGELATRGFDVQHTQHLGELDAHRLADVHAVVLFASPGAYEAGPRAVAHDQDFRSLIDEYVRDGGGALLMPEETNLRQQKLSVLTDGWDAHIPAERIVERSPEMLAEMPRGSYRVKLAYTDAIIPSPVTEGVTGLWYPVWPAYLAGTTMPLIVGPQWQVVVRGTPTSMTEKLDLRDAVNAAPNLIQRESPEKAPALMAIRQLGKGRVALLAQWPQFSFAAGTKWLFDRTVLERGVRGRPSHLGRLLENTLRWLSEPGLERTKARRQTALKAAHAASYPKEARSPYLEPAAPTVPSRPVAPRHERILRGLIGAKTSHSGGRSSVAEYAAAAKRIGLDFVVFLDDFARLTPNGLAQLKAECDALSDDHLLLLPGFFATNNLGNRMFFFSPNPSWVPDSALTGSDRKTLCIQQQDSAGRFTGYKGPLSDWIHDTYHATGGQVGYYDFRGAPDGMRLRDARLYGMAGIRYFRDGTLVEDVTPEYLEAAQSTTSPIPVAVHEVDSAAALVRQVARERGLTYVTAARIDASSPDGVYNRGLRWHSPLDAMSTFVSSGPMIRTWAGPSGSFRSQTYGAEGFAPGRSVMAAPLIVQSKAGLESISIFDGARLFRRIRPAGQRHYAHTLVLSGSLSRNLVVVAKDRRGGTAVSYPLRSWSDGAAAPVFCSDQINDCRHMLLARGPWNLRLSDPPTLPQEVAGITWDGGPVAEVSAIGLQDVSAEVRTTEGTLSSFRFAPVPLLDFSDEGAAGVTAIRRNMYDDALTTVINPWHTHGPVQARPAPVEFVQRFQTWLMASRGPPPHDWLALATGRDRTATSFTSSIRLRKAATLVSTRFARLQRLQGTQMIAMDANGELLTSTDLGVPGETTLPFGPGQALGFYGRSETNPHLIVNDGGPLVVRIGPHVEFVDPRHGRLPRGMELRFSLTSFGLPVTDGERARDVLMMVFRRLISRSGVVVVRGEREDGPSGILRVASADGVAEVRARKDRALRLLPMRVSGLTNRWSAALLQVSGFSAGFYGSGDARVRALAVDHAGNAHVPLDVADADLHVIAGHPVIADARGRELFIEATCLGGQPPRWHVSANNPTGRRISTILRRGIALPGLEFSAKPLTLGPGESVVLAGHRP